MITWCRHANNFISMGCYSTGARLAVGAAQERGVEQLAHMKKDSINLFLTRRSTLLFI